jgi:hypothetical protein
MAAHMQHVFGSVIDKSISLASPATQIAKWLLQNVVPARDVVETSFFYYVQLALFEDDLCLAMTCSYLKKFFFW